MRRLAHVARAGHRRTLRTEHGVEQIVEVLGKADRISYTRSYTAEESRLLHEADRKAKIENLLDERAS